MNRNKLLVYFAILLISLIISFFAIEAKLNIKTIAILIFTLVFIPTLVNPDIGLVVIIISMLFSPDIILGSTTLREVTLRIEDVFLLVVILAWFIRTAFTKDISRIFKTKLTRPFFLYIGACVVSTVLASIFSEIDIAHSFLSISKYLEYFLLFLIVKDSMRSYKQAKIFVVIFLLVALFVSIHSNIFIQQEEAAGTAFFRTSPPVETRGAGQAGTLGGYLLFMMGITGGLLLYMRPVVIRVFFACLMLLMFRAFLYTLSRGSYLAFLPMLFALVLFSKKITFAFLSVACLIIITLFMPLMIKERITQTVILKESIQGPYIELEESPRERLSSWKEVLLEKFPASPIFGHGVAKYFIDGQIFTTLCEVGLIGFILITWVFIRLFKMARSVFNLDFIKNDEFSQGLTLGFLAGFVGLISQSISTNTFIIIRIMEPFWFMAAMVLSLPQLLKQEEVMAEE